MRTDVLKFLSLLLLSAVIGAVVCIRWSAIVTANVVTDCGFINALPIVQKLLASLMAVSLLIACRAWKSSALRACMAVVGGSALFLVIQFTAAALLQVWYPSVLIILLVACPVVALAYIRGNIAFGSYMLVGAANLVPPVTLLLAPKEVQNTGLSSPIIVLGDRMALLAASTKALPGYYYWSCIFFTSCALCVTIAVVAAHSLRQDPKRYVLHGLLLGSLFGLFAAELQLSFYALTLYSGFDFTIVLPLLSSVCCIIAVATAFALRAIRRGSPYLLLKSLPLGVIGLLGIFLGIAFYGTSDYRRLDSYHNDFTWVYIHYDSTGGWQRTLDHSTSTIRLWRTQRFIETYPYSVYRPAALLKLAEYYYDAWQFKEAAAVLTRLQRDYPCLRSRALIIRSMVDLAQGKSGALLNPSPQTTYFNRWRRAQGAQLCAYAAERSDQPVKATGYFSYYIDYLKSRQSAVWIQPSLIATNSKVEDLIAKRETNYYGRPKAKVRFRVLAGNQPVCGARIVLVQPCFDAALPNDSRQFSGAWSIPAWNGYVGITSDNGIATISGIPSGKYEVVIGLNYHICPPNYVVSHPVKHMILRSGDRRSVDIRLVHSIALSTPRTGDLIGNDSVLRWKKCPGAAFYSVSITRISRSRRITPIVALSSRSNTCWAKTGIRDCQTPIDPSCFLGDTKSLESGALYMWAVYAYAADGSMVSSSEHYFDLRERVFSVH